MLLISSLVSLFHSKFIVNSMINAQNIKQQSQINCKYINIYLNGLPLLCALLTLQHKTLVLSKWGFFFTSNQHYFHNSICTLLDKLEMDEDFTTRNLLLHLIDGDDLFFPQISKRISRRCFFFFFVCTLLYFDQT